MPFAKKFRAMMNFPFPGDKVGDFTVESVDVHDEQSGGEGYVYGVRMTLRGPGGVQGVQRALRAFFSQHPTTFSGYGNPYQLWFRKPETESLGEQRYAVTVKGAGARVYLEPELRRFLQYLADRNGFVRDHQAVPSDAAAQEAIVEAYLEGYRLEIKRQVERYNRKLD
jgi:CubicO group peptidase (beta-lactamase class C family)